MSEVLERDAFAAAQNDAARAELSATISSACRRIAPLWPLKNFVAVNPFLGFSGKSFHASCAALHRIARIRALMPRAFYREAIDRGVIGDDDLAAALAAAPADWQVPRNVTALKHLAQTEETRPAKHPAVVATVAEVLNELAAGDRHAARTAFMIDEISRWCGAYFDEGQSVWRMPTRCRPLYAAWRESMRYDLNPEVMGVAGFRRLVAELPEDHIAAIGVVVERLGVPARAIEDYLHQLLLDISGWAAYARYLAWERELAGERDDTPEQLLAIRVVWGYTLFVQRHDPAFRDAWRAAMAQAAQPPLDERLGDDPALCADMVLQEAFEAAFRRRLLGKLASGPSNRPAARPWLQAAFCIDVRSEIFRRAMEAGEDGVETVGFAGFFGFPIEFVPIGHVHGRSHCPVLLRPAFTVCETVSGATEAEGERILALRQLRRRVGKAWKAFKLSAVTSFIYVETAGLLYGGKILSDSLHMTRPVQDPNIDGLDRDAISRLGPSIAPHRLGERMTGFDPQQRVAMAEAVLRAMSMTGNFARLVLLAGHGSTTVNNPHSSSLDCGACGGNTGEANARVAAAILNDQAVRVGLRAKGIDIPQDCWFIGGLHDTTTDAVKLFDLEHLPDTHQQDLVRLRQTLSRASSLARRERAALLGIAPGPEAERRVMARSRDWSQTRPEWGLAGNGCFIAAPRARTRGIDLGGRAFLHSYDWRRDDGFRTLELIMSAPMVVASWINLQYYGSTVNNAAFGSGNKVLHNVTGTIGVLEGNVGDLKVGLPLQSVHDGRRFIHEPYRLTVIIEAPCAAMNGVIARNATVRELADNRWIHLYAMDDDGRIAARYSGAGAWEELMPQTDPMTTTASGAA